MIDWTEIPEAPGVDLGDGWSVAACGGEAPLLCVSRGGTNVGTVELATFPLDSFTMPGFREAIAGGDEVAALRAAAEDYYANFRKDRAAGCGEDYVVETLPPNEATVSGRPGLRYGFTGRRGATVSERHLGYSAILTPASGDRMLVVQAADAYAEDGCLPPEGSEFTPEGLAAFAPVFERMVASARLPTGG